MPDQSRKDQNPRSSQQASPGTVDAIRHMGPTLESEGNFLPSGELPENRIENEGMVDAADVRAATQDEYDREAAAMGAERLQTRLPGDTSSDPHTDLNSELNPESSSKEAANRRTDHAA